MPPPNIIIFLTDDHGQWASGCYGSREIHSPSMDYLARTGARMDSSFTPSPVCSPARASFFTGKIPSAHGIHDYLEEWGLAHDHPGVQGQTILPRLLQQAGYQTAHCGKWHCNHQWQQPEGYDTWFTQVRGTDARFGEHLFYEGSEKVSLHGHQSTFIGDRAIRFLRERDASRPFFLFVGMTNTHTPATGEPARLVDLYREATFDDVPLEPTQAVNGSARFGIPTDPDKRHEHLSQYFAAVTAIDEQIGRVLDELEHTGATGNTLTVYTSDHGHMNGHHGLWTKGNATIPQNLLDESIKVPCLLSWPGTIQPGGVYREPVDHCDLFATVLDAAGAAGQLTDEQKAIRPGKSYLPLLKGEPGTWRDTQFCEYGNARMVRTAKAKLIRRYPGPNGHFADQYYDLEVDPREATNLIDDPARQQDIARLDQLLTDYFRRYSLPGRNGLDIAKEPAFNRYEPWRMDPNSSKMSTPPAFASSIH